MRVDTAQEYPTITGVMSMVTMTEVAELLGFEPDRNSNIRPPWREDERTPSCHLYEDSFYDFGSGRWGSPIDFVMAVQGCTTNQAVRLIWNRALKAGKEPGDAEFTPKPTEVQFFDLSAHPLAPGWTSPSLTLTEGQCSVFGLRKDTYGNLLIPHRNAEGVYGVKVRGLDGKKTAWPGSQFGYAMYNPELVIPARNYTNCVVCEGESDAWAMLERLMGQDVQVLALPSGSATWKDRWLEELEPFQKVFLCMDNDRAGEDARKKLWSKIGYAQCEDLMVPGLYNDAREAIKAGWSPRLT